MRTGVLLAANDLNVIGFASLRDHSSLRMLRGRLEEVFVRKSLLSFGLIVLSGTETSPTSLTDRQVKHTYIEIWQ